jgi:hypothetical protein
MSSRANIYFFRDVDNEENETGNEYEWGRPLRSIDKNGLVFVSRHYIVAVESNIGSKMLHGQYAVLAAPGCAIEIPIQHVNVLLRL